MIVVVLLRRDSICARKTGNTTCKGINFGGWIFNSFLPRVSGTSLKPIFARAKSNA